MVRRGLVVSDLHLLSDRSWGEHLLDPFYRSTKPFDLLVLNGDTFDFSWTNRPSIDVAIDDAIVFLERLLSHVPDCRVVYLLGNHDCITPFVDRLTELTRRFPQFSVSPEHVRIGDKLFLHGDICNQPMNRQEFLRRREADSRVKSRSTFALWLYRYIILFRLNRVVFLMHSRKELIRRIRFFFAGEDSAVLEGVTQVFFGHTHAPFRHQDRDGLEFVNTGSGIKGLKDAFCEFLVELD